jgi:hypothetical protein
LHVAFESGGGTVWIEDVELEKTSLDQRRFPDLGAVAFRFASSRTASRVDRPMSTVRNMLLRTGGHARMRRRPT